LRAERRETGGVCVPCTDPPSTDVERIAAIDSASGAMARSGGNSVCGRCAGGLALRPLGVKLAHSPAASRHRNAPITSSTPVTLRLNKDPALAPDPRNRRRRLWRGRIGHRLRRRRRRRGRLRGACRDKRRWNHDGNQRDVTDFFGNVRHPFSPELCKSYNTQSKSDSQQELTSNSISVRPCINPRCHRRGACL